MNDALSIASLAIYIVLAIAVLFVLVKHGRQGLQGWVFLFAFCIVRIIGTILEAQDSSAGSIIASVGLSPLLLAISGILHEARFYRVQNLNKKTELVYALAFHILIVGGVALTAAGSVRLQHHDESASQGKKIAVAGMVILAVAWGGLSGFAVSSYVRLRGTSSAVSHAGTVLLTAVCIALFFTGVRVFYSIVALSSQEEALSPTSGLFLIRLFLSFLPEVLAAIALVYAGVTTHGAARLAREERDYMTLGQKPLAVPENV